MCGFHINVTVNKDESGRLQGVFLFVLKQPQWGNKKLLAFVVMYVTHWTLNNDGL